MKLRWVRAKDGMLFGVCKGVARALDLPVGICRLLWIASFFCLGAGLGIYILLGLSLPREDKTVEALKKRVLGVCSRVAVRSEVEVGIVRFVALGLLLLSLGTTSVAYVVLHFVLDHDSNSEAKPSTPPLA